MTRLSTYNNEDRRQRTYVNKLHIDELTRNLLNYYSDQEKKIRLSIHLCKSCYYVNKSRIGGSAITTTHCDSCNKEITFTNTCTDLLCSECADKLKSCKHCGAKLD